MKKKVLEKITAGLLSVVMIFCLSPSAMAAEPDVDKDMHALTNYIEELRNLSEKLNPDSLDATEKYSETLQNWNIEDVISSYDSSTGSGISEGSLQFIFAQMQLELAQQAKEKAQEQIDNINSQQQKTQRLTDLRTELNNIYNKFSKKVTEIALSSDLKEEIIDLGIRKSTDADMTAEKLKEAQVDALLNDVTDALETTGNTIQQEMVYIQDFMGQYNAYLQNSSDMLTKPSSGLLNPGSGTMLGGSAGMLVTGILIGACLSAICILLFQRTRKKKENQ